MVREKDSHCSYCGRQFPSRDWPRYCKACTNITYKNPLPVAVLLLPVERGLMVIRRGIPPGVGELALPGGYMDHGETWQEACVRELREETAIEIPSSEVELFTVLSPRNRQGLVLIFGVTPELRLSDFPPFQVTEEATERAVLFHPQELAFPLHTQAMKMFFERRIS